MTSWLIRVIPISVADADDWSPTNRASKLLRLAHLANSAKTINVVRHVVDTVKVAPAAMIKADRHVASTDKVARDATIKADRHAASTAKAGHLDTAKMAREGIARRDQQPPMAKKFSKAESPDTEPKPTKARPVGNSRPSKACRSIAKSDSNAERKPTTNS
jgi:hypothetical protein